MKNVLKENIETQRLKLRRPKLTTPPQNAPPTKMSQMMVIRNASYRGEILATSIARLFPLVFG